MASTLRAIASFVVALALGPLPHASACGGFFCSTSPINQAREVVVYGQEADGTLTMAVQVAYDGRDEDFAWILPVPVPPEEIAVGTDALFSGLLEATEPRFTLASRTEGSCAEARCTYPSYGGGCSLGCGASADYSSAPPVDYLDAGMSPGVVVHDESIVGPYDTVTLGASSAAEVIEWLGSHGYDIPTSSEPLLEPYAAEGFVFVALRLTANRESSELQPVVMRMATTEACLPIRLTAIATTPSLPIVTIHLGDAQVASTNYSYADVAPDPALWLGGLSWDTAVAARVQELGGQAFATDFAGGTPQVAIALPEVDDLATQADPSRFLRALRDRGYAGTALLFDLFERYLVPPAGSDARSYYNCLSNSSGCGAPSAFDPAGLAAAIDETITGPRADAQALVERHPFLTRLSTSMRAEDMTVDPVFAPDADLPPVPQARAATLVTQCAPQYYAGSAPQVLELPGGAVADVRPGRVISEETACSEMGAVVDRDGGCSSTLGVPAPTASLTLLVLAAIAVRTRRRRR